MDALSRLSPEEYDGVMEALQKIESIIGINASSLLTPRQMYEVTKASGSVSYTGLARWYQSPCDCPRCSRQYRSVKEQQSNIMCLYIGALSISETQTISQTFCTRLFEDLKIVQSLLLSHGERVNTRWLNKANYKRRKFITRLRKGMYANEDALLEILNDEKVCPDDMSTRDFRDVFLLPYITVEALSTHGSRLLRLLHHRAFHAPEEWVTFDNRQLHAGWSVFALDEKFCPGCIIMHGKSYGKWTPFDATAVHNGDSYGAPRALLILEAQSLLARFLRDFMISMVDNIEKAKTQQASIKSAKTTALPDLEETSGIHLGITCYNQPFSPPPVFTVTTIDELLTIVSRKEAESHDHLWLLQTDCAYFHNLACYWKENNCSMGLRDGASPKDTEVDEFGTHLICSPLWQVLEWQQLTEVLRSVRQVYEARREYIVVGQPLPKDYAEALEYLQMLVFQLKQLTIVSPQWRSEWEVVIEPSLGKGMFMKNLEQLHKKDHILLCLTILCEGTTTLQDWDMALILKSLDLYLAKCGTREAKKIDPMVYCKITDIAALYQILTAIRMHRPTLSFRYTSSTLVLSKIGRKLKEVFENPRLFHFRRSFNNLDKFKFPSGKKNEQWLDRAHSARNALSQAWSSAREDYKKIYRGLNICDLDTEEMVRLLSYHHSPDVLAEVAQERQAILAHILKSKITVRKADAINEAVPYESSIPHVHAITDIPRKAAKLTCVAKTKPKTRRKGNSSMEANNTELFPALVCPLDTVPLVGVLPLPKKKRSLETLRLLFPTAVSELKGAVLWTDFVAMMQELGCSGQHRGGSEWTFWSQGDSKEGAGSDREATEQGVKSVQIHQPHPEPKLEAQKLQWIGKKLWRRFGWARECFEGL